MDAGNEFSMQFGERVGQGAQADVYARGDIAVKVYRVGYPKAYVFYEAAIMAFVEAADLPVAKVYEVVCIRGRMALKMSRVAGQSLSQIIKEDPRKAPDLVNALVDLQRRMHAKRISLPMQMKTKLRLLIADSSSLDANRKKALFELCVRLPEGDALCHGDFHGDNILYHDGTYTIIDWIDASMGCALGDACRTYLDCALTSQYIADLYLERYCAAAGVKREEILAWLPVQAGSMLGMISAAYDERLLQFIDRAQGAS